MLINWSFFDWKNDFDPKNTLFIENQILDQKEVYFTWKLVNVLLPPFPQLNVLRYILLFNVHHKTWQMKIPSIDERVLSKDKIFIF